MLNDSLYDKSFTVKIIVFTFPDNFVTEVLADQRRYAPRPGANLRWGFFMPPSSGF